MSQLVAALRALRARVALADELAEHHRRSAVTASAGMSELLSGLVAAEEATRGQLCAELHDTVAQSLAAARGLLAAGAAPAAEELVAEAEDQVRALMARTRPAALREGNLADAVGELRDDLHRRYGLLVRLRWPAQGRRLPLATAVTAYRFFQESLLNVVKHAEEPRARLELAFDGDTLRARVSDDGPGFDPALVRADRGRHLGLGLLRERVRLAGGTLVVDSSPGGPTAVTLSLPLPEADQTSTGASEPAHPTGRTGSGVTPSGGSPASAARVSATAATWAPRSAPTGLHEQRS